MKKIFAVIILAATLLSLLSGCGEKEPAKSGIMVEDVLGNLEEKLAPLADQYEMTLGRKAELESGSICQPVTITEKLLGDNYSILIYYSKEGDVTLIILEAERGKRTDIDFALLSYYLYDSAELPEMEADAFYDEFNLLTAEPDGFLSTDGWLISATTFDSFLAFSASYSPK